MTQEQEGSFRSEEERRAAEAFNVKTVEQKGSEALMVESHNRWWGDWLKKGQAAIPPQLAGAGIGVVSMLAGASQYMENPKVGISLMGFGLAAEVAGFLGPAVAKIEEKFKKKL